MPINWVRLGLVWAALIPLFLWPAFVNDGPIWFPDSLSYLSGPNTALEVLFGRESADFGANEIAGDNSIGAIETEKSSPYAGRSIYFGGVMFGLTELFGLWGNITFQAALFVATLLATILPFLAGSAAGALFVGGFVGILTAAPFFSSYMMPDYLAGIAIIAAVKVLGVPNRLGRTGLILWWLMLAFAVTAHTSHLLIVVGLTIVTPIVFRLFAIQWKWTRVLPMIGVIMVAVLAEALFSTVVTQTYGTPPLRPPFLAARLIDDGPGYEFLQETCPESGYELCNHLDRLPQYSDDFLWSRETDTGIYATVDLAAKKRMSEEQFDFAFAVIGHYPGKQFLASMQRFLEQLRWFGLGEFEYHDGLRAALGYWWSGATLNTIERTDLYRGTFNIRLIDAVTKIVVLLSIVHLGAVTLWRRRAAPPNQDEMARMFAVFAVLIVLGVIGNAAITGILSTPHSRYQARVIWLIPMISSILIWRRTILPLFKTQQLGQNL